MFKKIHFDTIDSTHKWALKELPHLSDGSYSISADYQTAGVGRKGNKWFSSPGQNILLTLVFPAPPFDLQNLAQLLAYSAIKMLDSLGIHVLFKWPNDLHLNNKKIAGVLSEIHDKTVILSIGLNVNMRKSDLFPVNQPATSLYLETKQEYSVIAIYDLLLQTFESDLTLFKEKGFAPFFQAFASRLAYIGKTATVEKTTGTIKGLHTDGRLILTVSGEDILISTGILQL